MKKRKIFLCAYFLCRHKQNIKNKGKVSNQAEDDGESFLIFRVCISNRVFCIFCPNLCINIPKFCIGRDDKMLKRKNHKIKKPLKEYYSNYYNHKFFRDFRYIFDNKSRFNDVYSSKKLGLKTNAESRALHFITKSDHSGHDGLLGGEISYFQSIDEYKHGDINQRWSDRLFFDFDIESDKVSMIKDAMKEAMSNLKGREYQIRHDELTSEFRELIFDEDLIYPTFQEAKKLCLFLEDLGLRPYLIFSGAKGFHINIFYEEAKIQNLSQVSRLFAKSFSDKLNLKYLDYAVFDKKKAQRRLQRCQYVHHSKTDLMTIPIPDIYDYDDVLDVIGRKNPRPIEFDFQEYSKPSEEFRESLLHNDKQFSILNARRERELKKQNEEKRRQMKKRYGGKYKNYQDISMIDLYSHYGGEIIKEVSGKAIVRCLFHGADRNPSAVIFKDSNYFHCSSCGKTLNYYSFIAEMEGTEDHHEIMSKADEFISS